MLHAFDNDGTSHPTARQAWMALLARAPQSMLEEGLASHLSQAPRWLRRPETGLMMVQGRAGGTGDRFNLGEITVTRCALRVGETGSESPVGVAYVTGRNHRQAQLAALADALLQDPQWHERLQVGLLAPVRQCLDTQAAQRQRRRQSTRVDFLTMAREAGGDGTEDPE